MSNKKKVGIITYYYNTTNYGGILQAYALCRYLNQVGNYAEQISYDYDTKPIKRGMLYKAKNNVKKILRLSQQNDVEKKNLIKRKKAFKEFDESFINSSKQIYTYKTLKENDLGYDLYICGSDQVWNPISMDENFFLDFVSDDKKKFAYAASIGADIISEDNSVKYKKMLTDYTLISVRENSAKLFLEKIGVRSEVVPDPVFLLDEKDWIDFIKDVNVKAERYILTYFLGRSRILKEIALCLSCKYNLYIIDISPVLCFENIKKIIDKRDAGPIEFLKLLYNAEYVLTNSFHCTAFSLIFQKKFLTEKKPKQTNSTANDRISTLLEYFDQTRRFVDIDSKDDLEIVIEENCKYSIEDYSRIGKKFIEKMFSINEHMDL